MMFNLAGYTRMLMADFQANGGKIEIDEFHTPADFSRLSQKTLINATGYGARALLGDQSITPVRGQLARMIPQPEINYGLDYKGFTCPATGRLGLSSCWRKRLLWLRRRNHCAGPNRGRARGQHHHFTVAAVMVII